MNRVFLAFLLIAKWFFLTSICVHIPPLLIGAPISSCSSLAEDSFDQFPINIVEQSLLLASRESHCLASGVSTNIK
jgi:hypothetical protein